MIIKFVDYCKNLIYNKINYAKKYKVYKIIKSLCSDDNEIMDMLNKICEAFDVIILFDSANECIDVCHREEFGEMTNIALTYDNAVKEIHMYIYMKEEATLTFPSDIKWVSNVVNLSKEDYDSFVNWDYLYHFIVGKDKISCYKVSNRGTVVIEGIDVS